MTELSDQMQRDMEIKNLSFRTKLCHLDWMRRFIHDYLKPPDERGGADIKPFLHFLLQEKGVSQQVLPELWNNPFWIIHHPKRYSCHSFWTFI